MKWSLERTIEQEVEHIFLTLPIESALDEAGYGALDESERHIWDVVRFQTEIENGGLHQFFGNSSGNHTGQTLDALRAISAVESSAVLEKACMLFPGGMPSSDWEQRDQQMQSMRDAQNLPAAPDAGTVEKIGRLWADGTLDAEAEELMKELREVFEGFSASRDRQFDALDQEFYDRHEDLNDLLLAAWRRSGAKKRPWQPERTRYIADYLRSLLNRPNDHHPLRQFAHWTADDADLEVWAAACEVLNRARERIVPEPEIEFQWGFTVRYLLRCVCEDRSGDEVPNGDEAAVRLAEWLKDRAAELPRTASALTYAVRRIGEAYLAGEDAVRVRFNSTLKHAFETEAIRLRFAVWREQPQLSEAWKAVMEMDAQAGDSADSTRWT
ncbi:MAG: DUF4375 domain-containing protein [Planctomycetales bacterium]